MVSLQGTLRALLLGETVWPAMWSTKGGTVTHKGKMAQLHVRMAADLTHLTDTIFGTVDVAQAGFQDSYLFSAELDSGSQCTAITWTIFDTQFPNNGLHQPPLSPQLRWVPSFGCSGVFSNDSTVHGLLVSCQRLCA